MRIALLLSGGLRNFEDTYSSFEYYLLNRFDIDVFFYGLENKYGKVENEKKLIETFNPVSYVINESSYYDDIPCDINYIKSSYYSFYNVYECNKLKNEYELENGFKYDRCIRCRLDFFWFRTISDVEIEMSGDMILTPEGWSFKSVNDFALSDIFCITNGTLIDGYCSLFSHIDEYCKLLKFHPESLIGYHINKLKIPNKMYQPTHFIFEYPTKKGEDGVKRYVDKFIPNGCQFVEHFDGNKNRKDFD